jgi:hypothetical protein
VCSQFRNNTTCVWKLCCKLTNVLNYSWVIGSTPTCISSASKAVGHSPNATGATPNAIVRTPNEIERNPNGIESTPHDIGSSPTIIGNSPNDIRSTPMEEHYLRRKCWTSPENCLTGPMIFAWDPQTTKLSRNDIILGLRSWSLMFLAQLFRLSPNILITASVMTLTMLKFYFGFQDCKGNLSLGINPSSKNLSF